VSAGESVRPDSAAVAVLRLRLLRNGYVPIPVTSPDAPGKYAGKAPRLPKWQTIDVTPKTIGGWERNRPKDTNTGLRTGHLVGLDIDVRDRALVDALIELATSTIGVTPLIRIGQAPKVLIAYRTAAPFVKRRSQRLLMPDGQPALVECLASGQQFVAFGTHPVTRQQYHWPKLSPQDVPLAVLPAITEAEAHAFVAEAERLLRAAGGRPEDKDGRPADLPRSSARRPASAWPPPTRQDVAAALAAIPNTVDWHWWVKIGAALFDALGDDGEDQFINWSAQSSKNDPNHTRQKWLSFKISGMKTGAATLFWKARQNGWLPADERKDQKAFRRQTARYAFNMLRAGIPGADILDRLHAENDQRSSPLPREAVQSIALWCGRQQVEAGHAA
jgi:hypothetical protein